MSRDDMNLAKDLHFVSNVYDVDPDLVLKRRFLRLHYFNLYHKHQRLIELDQDVADFETLKQTISTDGPDSTPLTENSSKIDRLLKDIEDALKDFDTASLMYQRSLNAPKVPSYLLQQIKSSACEKEKRYFDHYNAGAGWKECALHTATDKSLLHRTIDQFACLRQIFVKKEPKRDEEKGGKQAKKENSDGKEKDPIMLRYSEDGVRRVVDVFINLSFCLVVLIPTILLSYMKSQTHKMIVLAIFVLLSAIVSSFLASTMQKPGLGVIAAYTAILVVFLSNNPGT